MIYKYIVCDIIYDVFVCIYIYMCDAYICTYIHNVYNEVKHKEINCDSFF